jgi:hypothetical protein
MLYTGFVMVCDSKENLADINNMLTVHFAVSAGSPFRRNQKGTKGAIQ